MSSHDDGRSTVWWLFLAIVIAVIWAFFAVAGDISEIARAVGDNLYPEVVGRIFGHALVVALVVWAALYFLVVRRIASERGPLYFIVLFVAVVATEGGIVALGKSAADHDRQQSNIALAEMKKTVAHVTNLSSGSSGSIDMRIKSQGEAGEMERVSKLAAARTISAAKKYRSKLAALDYPGFMLPTRLAADRGLAQTEVRLEKARAAVKTYRLETEANISGLRADAQQSKMSESVKAKFMAGVAKGVSENLENTERILDCEDGIFSEFEAIAALLARPHGRWVASGKTIQFSDQRDLADYQAHILKIQSLAGEERNRAADAKSRMAAQDAKLHAN